MVEELRPKFMASVFDGLALRQELERQGVKAVHIATLWRHIIEHDDLQGLVLPNAFHRLLSSNKFKLPLSSTLESQSTSADGSTTKLLIKLQSGHSVEAVIIRHNASAGKYAGGPRMGGPRATLCISSQVGCKMACTFCATGTMGFKANLSSGEIVEQLVHALRITPIRNIVFMGMGEPLNNYKNVVYAVQTLTGPCFNLAPSRITISTVGIVPRILSLPVDVPGVNLAISLHAPTQELRTQIVPASKAFTLQKLMAAMDAYQATSERNVFIEYVMLSGVNDSEENANQLGSLLAGRKVVVNLIPYNPTIVAGKQFRPSSQEDVFQFQRIVREQYGIRTTVRQEMGQDIAGACGQLVLSQQQKTVDIEDLSVLISKPQMSVC